MKIFHLRIKFLKSMLLAVFISGASLFSAANDGSIESRKNHLDMIQHYQSIFDVMDRAELARLNEYQMDSRRLTEDLGNGLLALRDWKIQKIIGILHCVRHNINIEESEYNHPGNSYDITDPEREGRRNEARLPGDEVLSDPREFVRKYRLEERLKVVKQLRENMDLDTEVKRWTEHFAHLVRDEMTNTEKAKAALFSKFETGTKGAIIENIRSLEILMYEALDLIEHARSGSPYTYKYYSLCKTERNEEGRIVYTPDDDEKYWITIKGPLDSYYERIMGS